MLRLVAVAGLAPLLVVIAWPDAPDWLILAGWGVGALLLLGVYRRGRLVLSCPYCGKRVKVGASHCHHCGRQVWAESA